MHRSSSSNRVSEKQYSQSSSSTTATRQSSSLSTSASLPSLILRSSSSSSESDLLLLDNELPTFNPNSHLAMRHKSHLRFAQSSIHVIPFLLIFCGLVLWFFSKPVEI